MSKPLSVSNALKLCFLITGTLLSGAAGATVFAGKVTTAGDMPVAGAMVTFRFGSPFQERTVFSADDGNYQVMGLPEGADYMVRVRRIGWQDLRTTVNSSSPLASTTLDFDLQRHTDPAQVAAQLPANHWYELLLDESPWDQLKAMFDLSVMLTPEEKTLEKRLIARWEKYGHSEEEAKVRAFSNDIPNAKYALANSMQADVTVVEIVD